MILRGVEDDTAFNRDMSRPEPVKIESLPVPEQRYIRILGPPQPYCIKEIRLK